MRAALLRQNGKKKRINQCFKYNTDTVFQHSTVFFTAIVKIFKGLRIFFFCRQTRTVLLLRPDPK